MGDTIRMCVCGGFCIYFSIIALAASPPDTTKGQSARGRGRLKKALAGGGILSAIGLMAGCVMELSSGPVAGIYLAFNRSIRQYKFPFRISKIGLSVTAVSLVLDAAVTHTQAYTVTQTGVAGILYQNFGHLADLSAYINPAVPFFLTHIGMAVGWALIILGGVVARLKRRRGIPPD